MVANTVASALSCRGASFLKAKVIRKVNVNVGLDYQDFLFVSVIGTAHAGLYYTNQSTDELMLHSP